MFTGIIEQVATVKELKKSFSKGRLIISLEDTAKDIKIGESIAVNGACLTVANLGANNLSFDIMDQTLKTTNLGHLRAGSKVNIERSLKPNDRLGGHILSGHIDGTGMIKQISRKKDLVLSIAAPADIVRYLIPRGSIAIDGISLTVVDAKKDLFTVHIIPHTLKATNLSSRNVRDLLNIEVDMFSKYAFNSMVLLDKKGFI